MTSFRVPFGSTIRLLTAQTSEPASDPVPAYIGRQETVRRAGNFAIDVIDRTAVVAVVDPEIMATYDSTKHWVEYNGRTYYPDGAGITIYRNGRPHHGIIPMRTSVNV